MYLNIQSIKNKMNNLLPKFWSDMLTEHWLFKTDVQIWTFRVFRKNLRKTYSCQGFLWLTLLPHLYCSRTHYDVTVQAGPRQVQLRSRTRPNLRYRVFSMKHESLRLIVNLEVLLFRLYIICWVFREICLLMFGRDLLEVFSIFSQNI